MIEPRNMDQLTNQEKDIIALIMSIPINHPGLPFELMPYVVEVRLDDVMYNLKNPDKDVFHNHGVSEEQFEIFGYDGIHLYSIDPETGEFKGEHEWVIVPRYALDNIEKRAKRAKRRIDDGLYD